MVKQSKTPGKQLVKWDEELANLAKDATKGMELPTAKFISIKSGQMSFGGAKLDDNCISAIILGWVYENQFYTGKYDPNEAQVPSCYAFGSDPKTMAPHAKVEEPENDACATCPNNEFGSADNGAGKACKNVVRLALIASSDAEDLDSAEICYLKVPVMSVKNFAMYAKKTVAQTLGRPYWSVVTNISVVPDDKSQFRVNFEVEEKIEDSELFQPLKDLWEKTMDGIDFPYPAASELAERKPAKKAASKNPKFKRR